MKLTIDAENYTEQQEIFIGVMISRIVEQLEASGIDGEHLKNLAGKIAFEVASMIDGVSSIEFDGSEAFPYLTFQASENSLIHLGGNSYTHELVFGILNAIFSET